MGGLPSCQRAPLLCSLPFSGPFPGGWESIAHVQQLVSCGLVPMPCAFSQALFCSLFR